MISWDFKVPIFHKYNLYSNDNIRIKSFNFSQVEFAVNKHVFLRLDQIQ